MTFPIASGDVPIKWSIVEAAINAEAAVLDGCFAQQECPVAAREFLDIVAQGRERDDLARIGVINRAINLAIVPTSDMKQWGVPDHWSAPLETLTTSRGDCEDYAIAKYVALIDAGIPKEDVKLVIVHNRFPDEDHAVVAARLQDRWLILDNRTHVLVPDVDVRGATPLFVLDDSGVKMFDPQWQWPEITPENPDVPLQDLTERSLDQDGSMKELADQQPLLRDQPLLLKLVRRTDNEFVAAIGVLSTATNSRSALNLSCPSKQMVSMACRRRRSISGLQLLADRQLYIVEPLRRRPAFARIAGLRFEILKVPN